jgi:hypothetical protein
VGDPVTDTAFDGVLCRAGQPVAFWGSEGVRSCTLAKDTPAQVINYTDKSGNAIVIYARSSFTWVKIGSEWRIVDQHVSQFK